MSMALQLIRNISNTAGCEENGQWVSLCLHMIKQTEVVWLDEWGACFSHNVGVIHGLASRYLKCWVLPGVVQNCRCELHWTLALDQVVFELVNILQLHRPNRILWKMNAPQLCCVLLTYVFALTFAFLFTIHALVFLFLCLHPHHRLLGHVTLLKSP